MGWLLSSSGRNSSATACLRNPSDLQPCRVKATALCVFVVTVGTAKALTLFVAPSGRDMWNGQAPTRIGADGPKATLSAAIESARAARRQPNFSEPIVIQLRDGTYELPQAVRLTFEDSGAANSPFVICAYPNETPVLSGGKKINGWKRITAREGWWEAEVPGARGGNWHFRSLFIDGKRKQRARTPNTGFFRIQGESPQEKPARLKFRPGDIQKEWARTGEVELIALLAWSDLRMFIRGVDEANHIVTLSSNPAASNKEANGRYYIENAPDALDAPGEWYLDGKTGIVKYYGEPTEDLSQANVVAGHLDELVVFEGQRDLPVQNIVLRGLTFSYSDWDPGTNGYADSQAAIAIRGDIRAEFARNCALEDCTLAHLAGYALELGRGCQSWQVIGNEIYDVGAGGVRVGETIKRTEPPDMNYSQVITDNHIHDIGLVYAPAVGVLVLQSGTNRVAHNHIHHSYYTAISVGWNWGYGETPCHENLIAWNHLHHIGQGLLSDMGAVYTLGIQKGTVVRNNLIHDVESFTYGGWGLYPDEGSTDIVWENNVVYRTKSAGFHQHYGRGNIVRNNIFAFGREHQLMRTREEDHVSFIFTNNIVYFDSGTLLGSNWKNERFQMDGNVYFDARSGVTAETMNFAGASLAEWRARGHDTNSIVADPKFRNPQKYDFALAPESPALKLGFRPIDVTRTGVRSKPERHRDGY
jgi:hypothetical protein